jgi:hypothetical protein
MHLGRMEIFVPQLINGITLGSIYGLIAIGYPTLITWFTGLGGAVKWSVALGPKKRSGEALL